MFREHSVVNLFLDTYLLLTKWYESDKVAPAYPPQKIQLNTQNDPPSAWRVASSPLCSSFPFVVFLFIISFFYSGIFSFFHIHYI